MTEQLDNYASVQLELDVKWDVDDRWGVSHSCQEDDWQSFPSKLQEIADSQAIRSGFICIGLEFNQGAWEDSPCSPFSTVCCYEESPEHSFTPGHPDSLQSEITAKIPISSIYTHAEFRDCDNSKWPSIQELIRRGKHAYVSIGPKTPNTAAPADNFYFRHRAGTAWDADPDCKLQQGGSDPDNNVLEPYVGTSVTDTYISRFYPGGLLDWAYCSTESPIAWFTAVSNGFTFPATNCVDDRDKILDDRIHPPVPTYVNKTSTGKNYGTINEPFADHDLLPISGLEKAILRIRRHEALKGPSNVPVVLLGGPNGSINEYSLLSIGGRINEACTLKARRPGGRGPVKITR